jgi:glycosyltransferase involved in cell wall biosynthesis
MKKFSIIIPTRNRLKKLYNVLDTIPVSKLYTVKIICDADEKTFNRVKKDYPHVEALLFKMHGGSVWCRNAVIQHEEDGVLPCVDDIIFPKGYFEYIFELFNETFKDDDGVIGVRQQGKFFDAYSPTGMCLVGQKFLQRYPNRQLYYPKYYHFAAQEIYNLCNKIEKQTGKEPYKLADKYIVKHGKAIYSKKEFVDKTHHEARVNKKKDLAEKAILRKTTLGTWGTV